MFGGLSSVLQAVPVPENVTNKVQVSQEIRQRLAEAADKATQGEAGVAEATTIADAQAKRLYALRRDGATTAEETSGLLGDVFGYREKKDGSPSKTPNGLGKMIRDRVVRLYNAHEHYMGRDGGSFFEGLPKDETQAIVHQVETGGLTVWDAQKALGDLRASVNIRPSLAFDPKRILAIASDLSEEGAASQMKANASLQEAYKELLVSLALIEQGGPAIKAVEPEGETDEETGEQAAA